MPTATASMSENATVQTLRWSVQNWLSPAGQNLDFVLIGKSEGLYAFLAVSSTGRTERVWSGLV